MKRTIYLFLILLFFLSCSLDNSSNPDSDPDSDPDPGPFVSPLSPPAWIIGTWANIERSEIWHFTLDDAVGNRSYKEFAESGGEVTDFTDTHSYNININESTDDGYGFSFSNDDFDDELYFIFFADGGFIPAPQTLYKD